jgi:tetratricopeptide (TPR) repeat protein
MISGSCHCGVAVGAFVLLMLSTPVARADGASALDACARNIIAGQLSAAIDACSRAADSSDLDSVRRAKALQFRGIAFMKSGDLDRAIADLSASLDIDTSDPLVYSDRAAVFAAKGDYDGAGADFAIALARAPEDGSIYKSRGWMYLNLGDFQRALADFSKAHTVTHLDFEVELGRASALFALEDFSDAAQVFRELARNYAGGPDLLLWLMVAELRAGDLRGETVQWAQGDESLTDWPKPIADYLAGSGSVAAVEKGAASFADANAQTSPSPGCQAAFYLGEYDLASGQTESAGLRLRHAAELCTANTFEGLESRAELKRLGS